MIYIPIQISFAEWECRWTIANCTVTWFGYLWFWLCCWHSNGDVCHHENVVCSCRCRIISVISVWIWSCSAWMYRCLLPLWWSESAIAFPSHWTCAPVEWGCLFDHVYCCVPNHFVPVVEASYFKLNLELDCELWTTNNKKTWIIWSSDRTGIDPVWQYALRKFTFIAKVCIAPRDLETYQTITQLLEFGTALTHLSTHTHTHH